EVAAGSIDHAIRFVLPNDRVTQGFVRPATHGAYTSGELHMPPYGVHLRLRADYPVERLTSKGAQVVARALQTYGMYHADGGEDTLTAQSDRYTTAKWDGLLGSNDLDPLKITDFEVIDHGGMIRLTNDCRRYLGTPFSGWRVHRAGTGSCRALGQWALHDRRRLTVLHRVWPRSYACTVPKFSRSGSAMSAAFLAPRTSVRRP